jgi:hypothetical protein
MKAHKVSRVIGVRNKNHSLEMCISADGSMGYVNTIIKPTGHGN